MENGRKLSSDDSSINNSSCQLAYNKAKESDFIK